MDEIIGNITFNNTPILDMTPHEKLEIIQRVWLFEMGEFYEASHSKKIYGSKGIALLNVPDSFILDPDNFKPVHPPMYKNNYYEDSKLKQWIRISEMRVEKE